MTQKLTLTLTLALLLALGGTLAAFAANTPPAPANVKYFCSGGDWEWVKFAHADQGVLRRGTSIIKERGKRADTKKSTLAYDPSRGYFWEYTINPGGGQCQRVQTYRLPIRNLEIVNFQNCSGMATQRCSRVYR